MLNRKWTLGFTLVSLVVAIILNLLYFEIGFGMFYFLPIFGFIILFPKWRTGIIGCILLPIIRLATQFFANSQNPTEFFVRLTITSAVSCFIILTVTFFVIKLNYLLQRLEQLSLTDNLTSTFNRRYLELYSEKLLANALRYEQPLCAFILDLDLFKDVNDKYGHIAGDLVLKKFSYIVQKSIRDADIFVRLGGEEFALLLPNTPLKEGIILAERIRKVIQSTHFDYKGDRIPVTVSIGISQDAKASLEQLIERADQALYQAKAGGRNQVVVSPSKTTSSAST